MNGEMVTQLEHPCPDLDGLHIKPPEIMLVGSELAHKLIGRDFSEFWVSARDKELVYVTVRFPILVKDIEVLRAMQKNVLDAKEHQNG